ncbi:MAG: WecB/TagA/CpsF family glycosyltransferase [Terracidiphilus sp.]|jgi:N-acetylglucosaminyldiphosphoundecaprenol N-acetyl-beta-D-mannosaminyltransferase
MAECKDPRVAILGVAVDNLTMEEVLDAVEANIAEGSFHQIATANVDFLMKSIRDEELYETLASCDLVLADGAPLVWASRLLGAGLKERVAGADLVPRLAELSARRGYRLFLLGAEEESSAGTAAWMEKNYPGLCIAGRYCPKHQPLEEMDHEEILKRIEAARPDILLVAFGNPKQEKWLAMHRHRLEVPVCIGVGASFDFLSGKVSRAPLWMQQSGMEWLYRMMQEPSRLAKRYFGNAAGLLRYLPVQLAAMAMQGKRSRQARISQETIGAALVIHIVGDFTGALLPQFESDVRSAVVAGSHVVLDMSNTAYIGADALASLIYVMNVARCWKRELWLAGLDRLLVNVVGASRLRSFFRTAPKVAEALRRIQPELAPVSQFGKDWAFFRIGGQLVPIPVQEVPSVYHQVQQLLSRGFAVESVPMMPQGGRELDGLMQNLTPADAA